MSAWQPSRAVTQLILDFGRRFRTSLPRQVGADELIPAQVVALDPYGAGAIPRHVRVALHSGYHVDAYWRGSPPIVVGSNVVVMHFRKGDRYEILLAGGDSGLAPAGFPRRPALWRWGELTEYATIQQAINAAATGDTIFVPPGNYEETLTIEKDITLVGLGGEEGVTISAGNVDQPWVITSPCRVRDMAFRHSISSRTGIAMSGIYINASGQVQLEGIFINAEITASPDPDYSAVYVNSGSLNARHLRIDGNSSGATLGLTGINVHAGSSSIDQFTIQIDSAGGGVGILTDTGGSLVIYNGSIDVSASTPYSIYSSGNTSVYACRYDPNQVYGSLTYLEGDMPTWTEMDSRYVNELQANSITSAMLQGNIPPTKLATPPACRVYRSTSQTLPHTIPTPLSFDTEVFDYEGCWSSGNPTRLTAPVSGLYMVGGGWGMAYNEVVGDKPVLAGVRASNGNTYAYDGLHTAAGVGTFVAVSTLAWINAGDYVEIVAFHNMGANKPTMAATSDRQNSCHGWMVRVG